MKKKLISLIILSVISANVFSAIEPRSSNFDNRMQNVSFNEQDTTVIKTRTGFLSTVVFSEDEAVISTRTGFQAGWDVSQEDNVVYVSPRPVIQTMEDGSQQIFEPEISQWDTNLIVRTTKRVYSLELKLLDKDDPAYVVKFNYPQDVAKKRAEENQKQNEEAEKIKNQKLIAKKFEDADAPKNWNYFMRVNEKYNSRIIAPNFVYDNGIFTYIGFENSKTMPAPFSDENGKELSLTFNVEQKGNYRVMVIHSTNKNIVLRYGDSVVGIENHSYGEVKTMLNNTISNEVKRVDKGAE